MAWFLYLISALWIAMGSCAILYTDATRGLLKQFIMTTNNKVLSALPLVTGLLLIISASSSIHPWLVGFFGLLGLLKGAFIFTNPHGRYDTAARWILESVTDQGHRLFGTIAVILGTAVISWIA